GGDDARRSRHDPQGPPPLRRGEPSACDRVLQPVHADPHDRGLETGARQIGGVMVSEFRGFLTKTNALALAVGVIIGAAVGNIVSALAADILMPVIGLVLPGGSWREAKIVLHTTTDAAGKVTENAILYGHF